MEIENKVTERDNFNLRQVIQVLKDIKTLTQTYNDLKISIKNDYSEIKISHELEEKMNMVFEFRDNSWILKWHNLPDRVNLLRIGVPTTLKRAVESCKATIENLKEFYEVMDSIDSNGNVLEPKEPTAKDNWRIIKFLKNVYVKIELPNAINIKDVNVSFYGKSEMVQKVSEHYAAQECDEENIFWRLHYLKYDFDEDDDAERSDCGICLDFYNELNQCPIIFCDNPLCSQVFHTDCLVRHLKVSNVKVLNVAVGECPYCKFKIQANFIKENEQNGAENIDNDVEMKS